MYPVVDEEKCNGCGNCAEICPSEVYQVEEDKSEAIHPEDCIECWACVTQCPTESIRLHED
jgi:NAD-dependent dihydropyrimidine dehydrogenase PreA subunit